MFKHEIFEIWTSMTSDTPNKKYTAQNTLFPWMFGINAFFRVTDTDTLSKSRPSFQYQVGYP